MEARHLVLGVALLIAGGTCAATYSVTSFGADGSDSDPDRKAIQDALDKAKGVSDVTVVTVPAGTYYLDRALFIYPNTRLSLAKGAKFLRSGSTDQNMLLSRHLLGDGSECPGDETCTHGGHSQFSNIIVDGGTWDAASSDQEITGIFRLSHGSNLTIENVRFQGCTDHMLNISGSSDVLVRNCVFVSPVRYAGTDPKAWEPYAVGDENRFNTIESVHMDFTDEDGEAGNYPHDGTACERVTVTGCTFERVFSGIGNHHALPGRFSPSLTVQDCSFTDLQAYAVDCVGLTNCVIARCTSTRGRGLVHSSQAQFSATSNRVEAASEHAFFLVQDTNARLTENVVVGSVQGVNLVGASAELRRNSLSDCSDCGVRADGGSSIFARDNNVVAPAGYGFSFTGASSLLAVGNTVGDSGKSGFVVTGGGSVVLVGNTVLLPAAVGVQLEDVAGAKLFDNSVTSPGSHGVWLKNCGGALLEENEIDGLVNGHGVIVQGGSVEVVGNEIVCVSATKNGISAEDSAVVTARGNSIEGGLYGFCATAGAQLVAEGNDVSNVKNTAFYLANLDHPVVSGNIVSAPGNCGVQVLQTAGAAIRGNEITLSNGRGVLLTNSTGCEVSGNVIDGTDQEGIYCLESTGAVISGNLVSAALGIGIRVEGSAATAASADVVGNRVQSSSAHDIRICDNCSSCRLTENICTGSAATIAYSVIGSTIYQPGDAPCSAVQNESGTIFVRWERLAPVAGYVNGYLLDYGDNADFSGCTTVEIPDRDTVSYSLSPGSAKYVRVRSFHVYYGSVRYESTGSARFDVPVGEAKVVFDDCEGTGGPGSLSVPFGRVVPQLSALPTREGYAFAGYWTEPMGRGVNYVRADGVGVVNVEPDWLPSLLYAFWMRTADSVERPEISENPAPDPSPDPNPADIPVLKPASDSEPTPAPDPDPDPEPDPEPDPDPDPEPDPAAPQLYTTADTSSFAGNVTYVGWVRDATGALKGTLTVKIAKTNKKDGTCKPTISYIPFGGKKQTIKLDKSSYPVSGTKALLNIPGIGTLRLGGRSVMGVDVDVQAGADLTKLVETKAAAKARMAALAGVRTFALETEQGAAAFSVTVSKNGKGKLAGTLPDGTKVSLSAQGVLGGRVLAIPFAYSKKGSFGFVLWIGENGKTEISDMTSLRLASGRTLSAQLVAPSASHRLAPGTHSLGCELFAEPLPFVVEGSKWVLPRQNKRAVVDPNPYAAKLKFTEKTGIVKGSFSATPRGAAGVVKFTVNGVVVGSRFYGSAFNKGYGSLAVSAE